MAKRRDTVTYNLLHQRKVVYKGTTGDPERRQEQHKNEGKRFTSLQVTSRQMTEDGAKAKEAKDLDQYRQNHGGRNPRYNKDSDG